MSSDNPNSTPRDLTRILGALHSTICAFVKEAVDSGHGPDEAEKQAYDRLDAALVAYWKGTRA